MSCHFFLSILFHTFDPKTGVKGFHHFGIEFESRIDESSLNKMLSEAFALEYDRLDEIGDGLRYMPVSHSLVILPS